MTSGVISRTDRLLVKLDKAYGLDATYYSQSGEPTFDPVTGATTIPYQEILIRIRPAGLTTVELAELSNAGLEQVQAGWRLRKAYVAVVEPGHIIRVSGFNYQIIPNGATLDSLGILWTILTRRRGSL